MDDFNFWWYIIAAVIYFLTRGKKKKEQPTARPGSENNPPKSKPKSFEELLREITEGTTEPVVQEPVVVKEEVEAPKQENDFRREGRNRSFADDESKRVYEESIKMAEGADLKFERDEHFQQDSLFKGDRSAGAEEEWSIADDIKDGLNSSEAKKAIIYSEILARKY